MNNYKTINILDLIDIIGEDAVNRLLSGFSCPKNLEIESFVKKSAIDFAKRKLSVTHLMLNETSDLMAIFTLAHKALEIEDKNLSSSTRKKLQRYARLNETTNTYTVSAFLVAQFGKNYANGINLSVNGNSLMESAILILKAVQREVGGGIVYLECEDNPQLLSFYQHPENSYRPFNERYSISDQTKYIQLLRFF